MNLIREMMDESKVFRVVNAFILLITVACVKQAIKHKDPPTTNHHSLVFQATLK